MAAEQTQVEMTQQEQEKESTVETQESQIPPGQGTVSPHEKEEEKTTEAPAVFSPLNPLNLDEAFKKAVEVPENNDDLPLDLLNVECSKCGRQVPTNMAQARESFSGGATPATAPWRLWGPGWPLSFETLNVTQQKAFFQSVKALKDDNNGELTYKKLRDHVIKSLTQQKVEEVSKESGGTFQPLSVYAQTLGLMPTLMPF